MSWLICPLDFCLFPECPPDRPDQRRLRLHYYKFNIGDYASHTRHLSPIEDITYRRLLDLAYTSEQPLTDDIHALSRLINLREYQTEIQDVLNEFFEHVIEGWIHGRVLKELDDAGVKSKKAKQSALIRWQNKKNANAMQELCERNANALENDANALENDATQDPRPKTQDQRPTTQDPKEIIAYLNEKTGSNFKPVASNIKLIQARLKEGATIDEIKRVIDIKNQEWSQDLKMSEYLRPSTLFSAINYAQYSGQITKKQITKERGFVC